MDTPHGRAGTLNGLVNLFEALVKGLGPAIGAPLIALALNAKEPFAFFCIFAVIRARVAARVAARVGLGAGPQG